MKRNLLIISLFLIAISLVSCTTGKQAAAPDEGLPEQLSAEDQVATVLAQTAALEQAVYGTMTALAPPPTATYTPSITPSPTITLTPEPSLTSSPTLEPTKPDPNIEPWCNDHVGCERLEIKNNTNFWVNVFLDNQDTGEANSYSVPPRGHSWLTIRPGYFHYVFTLCGGKEVEDGFHGLNMHWYVQFRESLCDKYE
jgi:hypothetical protein